MPPVTSCGISTGFPVLSPTLGKVAHVLLARSPLGTPLSCERKALARLACVRHAASVNPEPGSNSPFEARTHGSKALSLSQDSHESFPLFSCQGADRLPPGPSDSPRAHEASWRKTLPCCTHDGLVPKHPAPRGSEPVTVPDLYPAALGGIPRSADSHQDLDEELVAALVVVAASRQTVQA